MRSTGSQVAAPEAPALQVRHLGVVPYREALTLQRELVDARREGTIPDTLLLLEHPPVFTLGRRRGAMANVLDPGPAEVIEVERGGDVTWHGPGQLVGYPILALAPQEQDLHAVLRRLEEAMIGVLSRYGLEGVRKDGHTGVWCQGRKIVSLGIAVRGWVTFHGLALNVSSDLAWFRRINPCGMSADVMTTMVDLGVPSPDPAGLRQGVAEEVARAFGRALEGAAPAV